MAITFVLVLISAPKPSFAADPIFAEDKALHFSLSAAMAGGGYALSSTWVDDRMVRSILGVSASFAAGFAKEAWDESRGGKISGPDLVADLSGAIVGAAIAYAIDVWFFDP